MSELYKVQFTVPEGWTVEKSPTSISATSPDKKVVMIIAGSESQDLVEAALNDLKKNLKFKDLKIEKQGTTTINGLLGLRGEGDAVVVYEEEENREQDVHFVGFSSKVDSKAITALLFTDKETYEKHMAMIEGVLSTLDKM